MNTQTEQRIYLELRDNKQINITVVPHDNSEPYDRVLSGCKDEVISNILDLQNENEVYF